MSLNFSTLFPTNAGSGGGSTPIGQTALFPIWYPRTFRIRNERFVRMGGTVNLSNVDSELLQFKKHNKRHAVPAVSSADVSGLRTQNAVGLSPGKTIVIGGTGFVLRSVDSGKSWTKHVIAAIGSGQIYGLAGNGAGVWIGQVNGSLWRSIDDGLTWETIAGVAVQNNVNSRTLYLGNSTFISTGSGGSALMRSTNNGVTWASVSMPAGYTNANFKCGFSNFAGTMIVQATHSTLIDHVYYRSFDYGVSWSAATWFDGTPATVRVAEMQDDKLEPGCMAFGDDGIVVAYRRKRNTADVPNRWRSLLHVSYDGGLTFVREAALDTSGGNGALDQQVYLGVIEGLCYVGDGKFIQRYSQNKRVDTRRDSINTTMITISQEYVETVVINPLVIGIGVLNDGDPGDYPHSCVEIYDRDTGDSALIVISNDAGSAFITTSEEILGSTALITEYVGGGQGYQGTLAYYTRVE